MTAMKRLVDYIRLNASSTEVAMQTEELLSMQQEQESRMGEEAWGRCLGGFSDGLHYGILQRPWPGARAGHLWGEMSCCGERGLDIF